MPSTTTNLHKKIIASYPKIKFVESPVFYYSAVDQTVHYDSGRLSSDEGLYKLIHELGHATLGHKNFTSGIKLIRLETEAWAEATKIADNFGIQIPNEYIERCLDSYRDWLHKRSTCPKCGNISVESDENLYKCFNCMQKWTVSPDQRSRCYRQVA